MTNDHPPLLRSWLTFRETVIRQEGVPAIDDFMLTFYGGAGTVLALLRSAYEQGGELELNYAFSCLEGEVGEFRERVDTPAGTIQ
jgi:hypothetical protein